MSFQYKAIMKSFLEIEKTIIWILLYIVPSTNIGTFGKYEQKVAVNINLHLYPFDLSFVLAYHWSETMGSGGCHIEIKVMKNF